VRTSAQCSGGVDGTTPSPCPPRRQLADKLQAVRATAASAGASSRTLGAAVNDRTCHVDERRPGIPPTAVGPGLPALRWTAGAPLLPSCGVLGSVPCWCGDSALANSTPPSFLVTPLKETAPGQVQPATLVLLVPSLPPNPGDPAPACALAAAPAAKLWCCSVQEQQRGGRDPRGGRRKNEN